MLISVKKLTASVNELTNGLRDSYTLTINGRAIENVTARTTAYIDDDTAAYERLRKQVNADILLSESAGSAEYHTAAVFTHINEDIGIAHAYCAALDGI